MKSFKWELTGFILILSLSFSYNAMADEGVGIYGFYINQSFTNAIKNATENGFNNISICDKRLNNKMVLSLRGFLSDYDDVKMTSQCSPELTKGIIRSNLNSVYDEKQLEDASIIYDKIFSGRDLYKNIDELQYEPIIVKIKGDSRPEIELIFLINNNDLYNAKLMAFDCLANNKNVKNKMVEVLTQRFGKPNIDRDAMYGDSYLWQKNNIFITNGGGSGFRFFNPDTRDTLCEYLFNVEKKAIDDKDKKQREDM